ncbi:hypothetical protein CONPUDRAFT_147286 [Coniophora puteana RWD-64-598 SS2]|uniref:HNH nuclease domain-containing protein n=1 Tax=Coniophora puteana (strain RWD-64-598) TaxID=741705 RepID=A0A5M3M8J0_CONPW|nr:uncharacterized protein CONPUDRAFT_147286 [Coniophora puteana RWD-64-598 SS2]EIW75105.1 hypothetical protein CONPUDRAFT_147286 [Coniophora puteana RWD-64-598 SS2]
MSHPSSHPPRRDNKRRKPLPVPRSLSEPIRSQMLTYANRLSDARRAQTPYKPPRIPCIEFVYYWGRWSPTQPHIAPAALKRARLAAPNGGRCAITNGRRTGAVARLLAGLEHAEPDLAWTRGMGWQYLDFACPSNMIFLDFEMLGRFHTLGSHTFFLLPEPHIMDALLKMWTKSEKEVQELSKFFQDQKTFKYYIVPEQRGLTSNLVCLSTRHPKSSRSARTVHAYPLTTLGPIRSHVKPHFALCRMCTFLTARGNFLSDCLKEAYRAALDMHDPTGWSKYDTDRLVDDVKEMEHHWRERQVRLKSLEEHKVEGSGVH